MEITTEFWTEIDQATRRRRIRLAVCALAASLAIGGTATTALTGDDGRPARPSVAAEAQ